ncbi:PLP-dependent aminotransferase family protein [Janibacter melonis]|uniref:MocR-like pyridoxine biosynthesis transcription factor PdxR n=1 Tax=Janibacter melonis TaxID=262209 RepID=UPI000A497B33|nr:PLP-dependent aminotransferase family protein [Janibacter melonis]
MRHPHDVDLPLVVDRGAGISLVVQVADGIRRAIESGALRGGDVLPSTRTLAERVGVSRGTVVAAFDQLHGEGWLVADQGATRVDPGLADHPVPGRATRPTPSTSPVSGRRTGAPVADLRPGQPDVSGLVDPTWRAAWREAAAGAGTQHPPQGSPALRAALAEHVRVARGTAVDPDAVVVTAGVREGLQLVLTTLSRRAGRPLRVVVEDPGYPALRRVVAALGHEVRPVPVDGDGLSVELLDHEPAADVVLVTPGHQYPLGGAMPVARRLALVAWARAHGAVVVEDDYDGELRFTGEPVPALAALDRRGGEDDGVVVTLGSFAKVLAPGIGVGHALVPDGLRPDVLALRGDLGSPVPATVQDALAHYLDAGALRRRTGRMRRRYRARRDLAVAALSDLPEARLRPMDGGLHGVVELLGADAAREHAVVEAAARAGVLVAGMGDYWADPGGLVVSADLPRHGLVIGLGSPHLERGLRRLRPVLGGVGSPAAR